MLSKLKKWLKEITKWNYDKAKKFLLSKFEEFFEVVKKEGKEKEILSAINNKIGTNFSNMNDVIKENINEAEEEKEKTFWQGLKQEGWGPLAFYPAFTLFLEFEKVFRDDANIDWKKTIFYAVMWLMLIYSRYHKKKKKEKEAMKENFKDYFQSKLV